MENVGESVGSDVEASDHYALYFSMPRIRCDDCETAFVVFVVHVVGWDWHDNGLVLEVVCDDRVVDWNVRSDGGNGDDNDGEPLCWCE